MMYNTLANENTKFRETIVELSKMCASNLQLEQTMKGLEDSNKRLMDRIEVADFQVKGLKHDNIIIKYVNVPFNTYLD